MNDKIGLISLGHLVAIALLLPTHARASGLTPLDIDGQPVASTSVKPLPKVRTDVVLETASEAVVSAVIAAGSPQQTQPAASTVVEAVNTSVDDSADNIVDTNTDTNVVSNIDTNNNPNDPDVVNAANSNVDSNDNVQTDALLLLSSSTSSSDLQPIAAPSVGESGFQAPLAQPFETAQTTSEPSLSNDWHFSFVPYIYIPFNISGTVEFEGGDFEDSFSRDFDDVSRDFEFSPSEIRESLRNSLNFAFLGALEAWTPNYNVGIITNVDYVSLSTEGAYDRDVRRPGFADFIPTELDADLDTQVLSVDLAASYRFYDPSKANPEGLNTEFDLGPLVFDVVGGVNLVSLNTDLGLSTNLGGEGEFSSNRTVISPLLGGRLRWNAAPELAFVISGSVSGFGISGLTRYGIQGGVNWLFSGNTSLGFGYRFAFLDYSSDEIDLNVDQNGPYLNIGFRF